MRHSGHRQPRDRIVHGLLSRRGCRLASVTTADRPHASGRCGYRCRNPDALSEKERGHENQTNPVRLYIDRQTWACTDRRTSGSISSPARFTPAAPAS